MTNALKEAPELRSFCEGVVSQKGGGAEGANPHTTDQTLKLAWLYGFRAAPGASAWAVSTAVLDGHVRHNGGNLYLCVKDGTTAASGGPTGTGQNIDDNGVLWDYMGPGTSIDLSVAGYPTAGGFPYHHTRQ